MSTNPLPREIAPGVFWLGDCIRQMYKGRELHGYNSVFLVQGEECCALIEGGHPQDLLSIETQLDELLARGLPPLRYLFTTHTETPHSSGLGRVMDRFPDTIACGDVEDLHMVFPQFDGRFRELDPGDSLDLGGTELQVVEAVFRDFAYTRWAFDTQRGVLFAGDGFAYSHYHEDGHCGKLAEEAPSLELPDMTALFAELAFYWTRFVDIEPYIERLEYLVREALPVKMIAPTHGLPIGDIETILPRIYEGLRLGSTSESHEVI